MQTFGVQDHNGLFYAAVSVGKGRSFTSPAIYATAEEAEQAARVAARRLAGGGLIRRTWLAIGRALRR